MIANTVADPRAMVIHFCDTNLANRAVVSAYRFPIAAMLTVAVLIWRSHLRDHNWPSETGNEVRKQSHGDNEVVGHLYEHAMVVVIYPLVEFKVHQVERHDVEASDEDTHAPYEGERNLTPGSEHLHEEAVASHAHFQILIQM